MKVEVKVEVVVVVVEIVINKVCDLIDCYNKINDN